ncbi:MAG: EAL domain-containing protein [Solobacterium sp.]|nr:EAL domain-containing protein [Solobacterium sp.]
MRNRFAVIFLVLSVACAVTSFLARRSEKPIGRYVSALLFALVPPILGNLILTVSTVQAVSLIGLYIYFLGMDLVMAAVLEFSLFYCNLKWANKNARRLVYLILVLDAVQLLLNPLFHHAFGTEMILVDRIPYYRVVPFFGQTVHRIVDYGIFAVVLFIFFRKTLESPKINSERYSIILVTMIATGLAETFFIFSRTPIDQSMIGFGVFGLLVYVFSLHYRPTRLLNQMLAGIVSEMEEMLFFFDHSGRCIWANEPGLKFLGLEAEHTEQVSAKLQKIFGSREGNEFEAQRDWTENVEIGSGEECRYYVMKKRVVKDPLGEVDGSFLSIRDHTKEQKDFLKEKYLSSHDILTGLYNRETLYQLVRKRLDEDSHTQYAVIYLDVKEFKIINDIFGRRTGDQVLIRIADALRSVLCHGSIYGRLEGDKFGVFLPIREFDPGAMTKNLSHLSVRDSDIEHHILIHFGVYVVKERDLEVSVMFDRANMALQTIKQDYQQCVAYYGDEMRERVLWSRQISEDLPEAIELGHVLSYLQPIVNSEGRVVGAEMLARWKHPEKGFLSPALFIPVLEDNGMIAMLDKCMWENACRILSDWKVSHPGLFISVNISPKDFYFMDVMEEIIGLVKKYEVDPRQLRVEITETVMMTDAQKRLELLRRLRESGVVVEIDDFGSGFSSLNLLKDMPADVLKIDMFFLTRTDNPGKAKMILHNVLNMSEDLGIASLTEGVETEEQYIALRSMGCRMFQGYYFAKPMPAQEIESFIEQNFGR